VLTDTLPAYRHRQAFEFAARGVFWGLSLFGVMRVGWFEVYALLPLTRLQAAVAATVFGTPAASIDVTLACSAADALALCAGAILGYPARWQSRLAGVGGSIALILGLNTVRIGALGRAAASPSWFEALHVYVWPAVITFAIAGYVFGWMRCVDGWRAARPALAPSSSRLTRRFVLFTVVFLALFTAAAPLYLESAAVLAAGAFIARAAASVLNGLGAEATATTNLLSTSRGAFLVTQECIATPLIPVYVAAVVAYSSTWRWRSLALLATVPLFAGLGIARLLVVALPAALVDSPMFLIHAFYQLLLAGVLVVVVALWRHGRGGTAWRRALAGSSLGIASVAVLGPVYTGVLMPAFAASTPLHDPQGAIALLPSFQVGFYVALFVAAFVLLEWRPFVLGIALLGLSQIAALTLLHVVSVETGVTPHVRDVRAWALGVPLLLVAVLVTRERPRH
jgi:exosortase/archaeosortase family protein